MAYSDEALAFATIPVNHQIRLEDRISYLYLEYATIRQDRTGVVAYSSEEGENIAHTIQIPWQKLPSSSSGRERASPTRQ